MDISKVNDDVVYKISELELFRSGNGDVLHEMLSKPVRFLDESSCYLVGEDLINFAVARQPSASVGPEQPYTKV